MKVGVREFKAHLSEYLARLGDGESVIITRRGKPVARIEAVHIPDRELPEGVRHLIETGRLVDKGPMRDFPPRIQMTPGKETSTDFVREQRR